VPVATACVTTLSGLKDGFSPVGRLTYVVEVPFRHLREAMPSLALQGFADVRAYDREVVTDNDDTRGTRPA
jgi:hypothetical protein